jgi:hypothetical protein
MVRFLFGKYAVYAALRNCPRTTGARPVLHWNPSVGATSATGFGHRSELDHL